MHKTTISYSILLFSIVFHMQAAETSTALLDLSYNTLIHLNAGPFRAPLECYDNSYYKSAWSEIISLLPSNLHTNHPFPSLTSNNDVYETDDQYRLYLTNPYSINIQNLLKKRILLSRFLELRTAINANKNDLSIKKSADFICKALVPTYNDYLQAAIKYSSELVQPIAQPIGNKLNQYNPSAKNYGEPIDTPPRLIFQQSTTTSNTKSIDLKEDSQNIPLTTIQFVHIINFFNDCEHILKTIDQRVKRFNDLSDEQPDIPHYPTIWQELEKLSKEMGSSHINYQATIEALTQKYAIFIAQKESADSADNAQRERELLQSTIMMYPHMDNIPSRNRINISNTPTPRDKCITIQNVIDDRMLMVNRILNK